MNYLLPEAEFYQHAWLYDISY